MLKTIAVKTLCICHYFPFVVIRPMILSIVCLALEEVLEPAGPGNSYLFIICRLEARVAIFNLEQTYFTYLLIDPAYA